MKFIQIQGKTVGKINGMTVKRPSSSAFKAYDYALDCYFDKGDKVMFLDERLYTEKELDNMSFNDMRNGCFIDGNYRIATVIERKEPYFLLSGVHGCKRINNAQGYSKKLLLKFDDNGKTIMIHPCYWLLIGKIF